MPDATSANFPDILSFITGGDRCNVGVVQLALAVRPRVVRAGRPFEALLLVQNAADVDVDLVVSLQVPETDARRQKGRFISKRSRIVVGLHPAEVGYVALPLSCLADTAVSDDYHLGMEVTVKPLKKSARVRSAGGGGAFEANSLRPETRQQLEELRALRFSSAKRFGLRDVLEAPFSVLPGKVGQLTDLSAGWVSLWTLADMVDTRALLARYGATLAEQALPLLGRAHSYAPLLAATNARFTAAGCPLHALEAMYVTKMLVRVLEMALPQDNVFDYLANPEYNVALTVRKGAPADGSEPALPRWGVKMLRTVSQDAQAAARPAAALAQLMYADLLHDAIIYSFAVVKTATGEEMDTDEEIAQYAGQTIALLESGGVDVLRVYMPLVLAGIVLYDRVVLPNDDLGEQLVQMGDVLAAHESQHTANSDLVFTMARQLINRSLQKYGVQI